MHFEENHDGGACHLGNRQSANILKPSDRVSVTLLTRHFISGLMNRGNGKVSTVNWTKSLVFQ